MSTGGAPLQLSSQPRTGPFLAALVVAAVVGIAIWYANTPARLPVTDRSVSVSTPVDQPVYFGVFAPSDEFGRTLTLSGVKVHTTSNTEVQVVPLLCRGGTVGVTSDPETFCADLVNPEGKTFGPGDDLILEVTSAEPAVAVIDRVELGFREGLRWGTHEAGAPSVVRVLAR